MNKIIRNTIKSQINKNTTNEIVIKGSKCLLCNNFIKKGNILKISKSGKKLYNIPIIINSSLGGNKYKFNTTKNINGLKKTKIYEADYKLIKLCSEAVWNKLNN